MPAVLPDGLVLGAFPRARRPARRPRDAARRHARTTLPAGSVVGTSSLRRRSSCSAGGRISISEPIRGNVDTRLAKLEDGHVRRDHPGAGGLEPARAVARRTRRSLSIDDVPARGRAGDPRRRSPRGDDARTLELLAQRGRHSDQDGGPRRAGVPGAAWRPAVTRRWRATRALDGAALALTGLVASLDGRTVMRWR